MGDRVASRIQTYDALERAFKIREQEDLLLSICPRPSISKPLPVFPEPVIKKCHTDHLLEEMRWLAGDYVRERKWRHANCIYSPIYLRNHTIDKQLRENLLSKLGKRSRILLIISYSLLRLSKRVPRKG